MSVATPDTIATIDTDVVTIEQVNPDDPIKAHYIVPPAALSELSTPDFLAFAIAQKMTIEAICGHRWVPTNNGKKNPVCQACVDIAAGRINNSSGGVPDDLSGLS